jgi:hypothetical protein
MCADRHAQRPGHRESPDKPPAPDAGSLRDAVRAALELKSGATSPDDRSVPAQRNRSAGPARPGRGGSAGRGFRPVPRRTG